MPKYKNNTEEFITIGGTRVNPGKEIETDLFYDHEALGLSKISDEPFLNPVILSELHSGDAGVEVIDIPLEVNGRKVVDFGVNIYCLNGAVDVMYNSTEFDPVYELNSGDGIDEICKDRNVNSIILDYKETGTNVKVNVIFR